MTTTNRPAGGTVTHTGTQIKSQANGYSFGPDDTYSRIKGFFDPDYKKAWEEFQRKLAEEAARQAEANAHAEEARVEAEKEQALAIVRDREARIKDLHDYLHQLGEHIRMYSNCRMSATVANMKGGVGKTPLSAYMASTLADYSRRGVIVIDHNEMRGTTAVQLGLGDVPGMTVRQAFAAIQRQELNNAGDYLSKLPTTKHGVAVLSSDSVVGHEELYLEETSDLNIKTARRHIQFAVNDTGNYIQGSAMRGVLNNTNVLLVPTLPNAISTTCARETITNLRKWNYDGLVDRAIVVVIGIPDGATLESYRDQLGINKSALLFAVPHDERGRSCAPVDLDVTDFYVRIAYNEITLASLLVAHAADRPETAKRLSDLRTGKLVELPSGRTPVLPWIDGSDRLI